jgi:hypothetical protein
MNYTRIYPQIPPNYRPIVHSVNKTGMALWTHRPYLSPFFPLSSFGTGAHKLHFLNHVRPLTQTFPLGYHFPFSPMEHLPMTHSGTPAHVQNYQINACMFDSLQIFFTSGILFFMCAGTWSSYISATPSGI